MSELSGVATAGIETVEWIDGGNGNLVVRVTGRWRRRRPAANASVALVVESEGRRHRFPAMPEPPSLNGAGPGMWGLSFSVPGSLAPALGSHAWLSLGSITVALPAPGVSGPAIDEPEPGPPVAAEPAPAPAEPAGDPAGPAVDSAGLERRLAEARAERDRLSATLAEGERTRRIAEQRAHAEHALRRDLARQLSLAEREARRAREAMGDLATAEDQIRELERELSDARRRGDEAEQLAAAARVRARRAARGGAVAPAGAVASNGTVASNATVATGRAVAPDGRARESELARLRFEAELRARRDTGRERVPSEPHSVPPPAVPGSAAPVPTATAPVVAPRPVVAPPIAAADPVAGAPLVETLRRELDARAAGDAALRARLVAAESSLAARVLLEQRTRETLTSLGEELTGLRAALEQERARRRDAERLAAELESERRGRRDAERRAAELEQELGGQRERSREAHDAIVELRGTLAELVARTPARAEADDPAAVPDDPAAVPDAPASSAGEAGPVQADRLSDALSRLRESVPPTAPDVSPAPGTALERPVAGHTLNAAFRRLVSRDADAAGELLLDLLSLQAVADPRPIAYDLVLGPGRGCVRVTVGEGPAEVVLSGAARRREEIDFAVRGRPARIARLLTAHGIWRRIGPRVARVRGDRGGLRALEALLALPLDLRALIAAGASLRAESALALVAAMVDPADTRGERFVVAHRDAGGRLTCLVARDGKPLAITAGPPAGRVATTISGPTDGLVAVLAGGEAPEAEISGDDAPLAIVRAWVKRAQNA